MDKKKYSEVFSYTDENNVERSVSIVIPMIQRDYAQGRSSASEIRKSFVKSIHDALVAGKELNLDFVYGSYEVIDDNIAFVPLDGQQRLTTLFLLYWLVSKRENVADGYDFIKKFTYKTRHTTRAFCDFLNYKFNPLFEHPLSYEIKEDPQFILLWENDPTVKGMIVMLDELNNTFYGKTSDMKYWDKLQGITFFFANLDELGISDEIYIKMNSRGKPLTSFEHFKAELDNIVSNSVFSEKVDTIWTDVFWNLREDSGSELPVVDDSFLRYFHYIANIICYKKDGNVAPEDDFEMLKEVYNDKKNQDLFEKALDVWVKNDSDVFFSKWFVNDQTPTNSFKVNLHESVNLLKRVCSVDDFKLRPAIMLWGVITYLMNTDKITEEEFRTRIRVLRNLTSNSEYEMRVDRSKALVTETEELILSGIINLDSSSFNQQQKVEEVEKLKWISKHDTEHELHLSALENNNLLLGSTCLIGTDGYEYFDTFNQFFSDSKNTEEWIELTRAFLTYGDVSYRENNWRVLVPGQSSLIWRNYLGPTDRSDFKERASGALLALLKDLKQGKTCEEIVRDWIGSLDKFDWRYYFVKYPTIMKKSQYGKYWFPGDNKDCHFYSMYTERSTGGRHYEGILLALSKEAGWVLGDEYGATLMLEGTNIFTENDYHSVIIKESTDNGEIVLETIDIKHENHSDLIDRVELLKPILDKYLLSKKGKLSDM